MMPTEKDEDYVLKYNKIHVQSAVCKWKKIDRKELTTKMVHEFGKFIGYPHSDSMFIVDIRIAKVREIIDAINGPYGNVILKMLELKNARR